MAFPVLAFTPNGVMPYSRYENLLRVMKHEFDKNWYHDLEVVDSNGACAVVRAVKPVKQPVLTRLFTRMTRVEIEKSEMLTDYTIDDLRSRVREFLSIYHDMHHAAGAEDIHRRITEARDIPQLVSVFME